MGVPQGWEELRMKVTAGYSSSAILPRVVLGGPPKLPALPRFLERRGICQQQPQPGATCPINALGRGTVHLTQLWLSPLQKQHPPSPSPARTPVLASTQANEWLCLCLAQGPHPSVGKVAAGGGDLSRIAPASLAQWGVGEGGVSTAEKL